MHRHTIRHGFLAVLIGALLVGAGSAARAGWPGQHADRHPHYRFGVVEAYYRPGDALDLGVGWERIIFEWAAFQPNGPDEYRTEAVPVEWLADAQRAGREVIGLLKNTPLWASDIHKLGAPPNGLHLPIDDPGNYWAAFVRRTVEEYGREWGINHWIIYNEPDIRPGDLGWYEFDGDVEDYYNMVKVAYRAAKSANPRAKIHLAGMAWYVDLQAARDLYLERLLRVAENDPEAAANGYFFDVVMVHTYFDTLNVWQMIRDIRRLLHRHGLYDKPLWVDETNARPSRDDLADVPPGMFEISLSSRRITSCRRRRCRWRRASSGSGCTGCTTTTTRPASPSRGDWCAATDRGARHSRRTRTRSRCSPGRTWSSTNTAITRRWSCCKRMPR